MFGYCETKTFNGKSWNPSPSYAWKISTVKLLKHKRVLYEMFRYWETNIFEAQSWSPDPFFLQHFLHLGKYLKHRGVPWRTLSVLWNKTVFRRIVIHLPFSCMKNFDARFFWSEEVFPNEIFQYCETKKLMENRDAHPVSYPKKHFSISKSFWSTIGFLYKMFQYCETSAERRNFSGESWYTSPSYARKISILKICWNKKVFLYEMLRYCEPKTLTRILMPTPFLVLNFFRYRKFSEQQKGSLTKFFGTVEQNMFTENPDSPNPLMHEKFLNQFFSETMKASLRNVSIQWDKNVLGQSWCPPFFLSLTFFDIEKFLKHRTVHLRNVWVLWDKNFQRKIVKPFPLVCMKNFFGSKTSETQWRFPYEFFRYCEPKKLTRIVMPAPFVYLNIFQYQKLSETQKGSSTECFATEKQTILKHSRDAQTLSFFNIFSIWKFIWNTEGFLDELFWYCETKQSYGESWYPSPFYA